MKLKITIREKNPNYSKAYAEQYHFGEESVNNQKDNYSRAFELSEAIDKIEFEPHSKLVLNQLLKNGETRKVKFPEASVLHAFQGDRIVYSFGISKSILLKTHKVYNDKYDITRFYFYVKPGSDYQFPLNYLCAKSTEWDMFEREYS